MSSRRAIAIAVLVVLLLAAVALLFQTPDLPEPGSVQGPVAGHGGLEEVVVILRAPTRAVRRNSIAPPYDAVAVWPEAFELPDLETSFLVTDLALGDVEVSDPRVLRMLEVADSEGLVGGEAALTDPARAFVELEVARWRVERTFQAQVRSWMTAQLPPGEALTANRFRRLWRGHPDRPVQDTTPVLRLARAVQEAFPGHPVVGHAALHEAFAVLPKGVREGRDAPDVSAAFAALERIEDPDLAVVVAVEVSRYDRWIEVPDWGLDAVGEVETTSGAQEVSIAEFAYEHAMKAEDWDRALAWEPRVRAGVDAACLPGRLEKECATKRAMLRDVGSRMVGLGLRAPRTWQETVTAIVWGCHARGEGHEGESTGTATVADDALVWGDWTRRTAVTRCVEGAELPEGPPPPVGEAFELTIHGPEGS